MPFTPAQGSRVLLSEALSSGVRSQLLLLLARYLRTLCELPSTGRQLLHDHGGGADVPHPHNSAVWNKLTTVPVDFFGRILTLTEER